jgi:hypothetical protein
VLYFESRKLHSPAIVHESLRRPTLPRRLVHLPKRRLAAGSAAARPVRGCSGDLVAGALPAILRGNECSGSEGVFVGGQFLHAVADPSAPGWPARARCGFGGQLN